MSYRPDMRGFTLIELMIVLALLAIAAGIALPNFARLITNNQIEAQAQTLNSLLQFARSQAVIRRTSITLSNSNNEWVVTNANNNADLRREAFNPDHASITSSQNPISLTFTANGSAVAASFIVCKDNNAAFAYLIDVQPSGHTRLMPRGKNGQGNNLGGC